MFHLLRSPSGFHLISFSSISLRLANRFEIYEIRHSAFVRGGKTNRGICMLSHNILRTRRKKLSRVMRIRQGRALFHLFVHSRISPSVLIFLVVCLFFLLVFAKLSSFITVPNLSNLEAKGCDESSASSPIFVLITYFFLTFTISSLVRRACFAVRISASPALAPFVGPIGWRLCGIERPPSIILSASLFSFAYTVRDESLLHKSLQFSQNRVLNAGRLGPIQHLEVGAGGALSSFQALSNGQRKALFRS